MRWTKGTIEALHKGTEAYMAGLMEDANLLAIHACYYTVQPRDIQLARRIRGRLIGMSGLILCKRGGGNQKGILNRRGFCVSFYLVSSCFFYLV